MSGGNEAEMTLPRDSEERFRHLVENFPGVVYVRRHGALASIQYVNDAIERLIGYSREEVLGGAITFAGLCHPEDRATYDADIERAVTHRHAFHLVYRLRHVSGEWRWVEEHGVGVYRDGEIESVEGFITDINERRVAERRTEARRDRTQATIVRQLIHEATHDGLTGLINRAEFGRRLERALHPARAGFAHHALCYLDLDGFKQVNDTSGHLAGDAVLRQVSQALRTAIRSRDTLARIGGDEFALLLEHCSRAEAAAAAANLIQVLRKARLRWKDRELSIGISIGVAPFSTDSGDAGSILGEADAACYHAKRRGGDCIHVSDDAVAVIRSKPSAGLSRANGTGR
jgi:diguanylate cyclase (GGDEF)-like protein/PAS domain S-box-containing protein